MEKIMDDFITQQTDRLKDWGIDIEWLLGTSTPILKSKAPI